MGQKLGSLHTPWPVPRDAGCIDLRARPGDREDVAAHVATTPFRHGSLSTSNEAHRMSDVARENPEKEILQDPRVPQG